MKHIHIIISKQIKNEMNKKLSILIGFPCYDGKAVTSCLKAVMDTKYLLMSKGIGCEILDLTAESLITRGRNAIMAYFLCKKEHSHMLFIDSDITYDPNAILRLIDADKDIIGFAYPKKNIDVKKYVESSLLSMDWTKLYESVKSGKNPHQVLMEQLNSINVDEVQLRTVDYVFNPIGPEIRIENGLLRVAEIGTGSFLVKREVADKLVKTYPELKYHNDLAGYNGFHPEMKNSFYTFFDTRCEPIEIKEDDGTVTKTQRFLSEDYFFCKLCQKIDKEVWLYCPETCLHTGVYNFRGNFLATIALRSKDNEWVKKCNNS